MEPENSEIKKNVPPPPGDPLEKKTKVADLWAKWIDIAYKVIILIGLGIIGFIFKRNSKNKNGKTFRRFCFKNDAIRKRQ